MFTPLTKSFEVLSDALTGNIKEADSGNSDSDEMDEPSALELRIVKLEAKAKSYAARMRGVFTLLVLVICVGVLVAMFGPYFYPERTSEIRLFSFGLAGYMLALGIFSRFIYSTRLASYVQEIDVLKAKKRILGRSLEAGAYTASPEQPVSYFDRLVDINVTNLGAYYGLIKVHTNNSFLVSIAAGGIGFILILTGLIVGFTNLQNSQTITYVATGAGIVTEFIAGVFFYLYNRTVRQMKEYHDSLLAVQNILLSFKIVGDAKDEKEKAKMVGAMLGFLVGRQANGHLAEQARAVVAAENGN